jgi:glycosyltransferase involved in cell wall biosynthesis
MNLLEPPLVTVALPVFNGGDLLNIAVISILNQSYKNWELFVIDDGSSDKAVERVSSLGDPRIFIFNDGLNRGLSNRLNQAISLSNGKYFARMDHDDICHPHRFEKQVEFLEKNKNIDLLATQCIQIDEHENILGILHVVESHEELCSRPWLAIPMAHPTWMGRVEWFRKNLYMDPVPYCCDDNELLLRAHSYSSYHCLSERLLAYRLRTHTSWQKRWKTRVAQLKVQISYFKKHRRWGDFFLCFMTAAARVSKDLFEVLRNNLFIFERKNKINRVSSSDLLAWEEIIIKIKKFNISSKSIDFQ